ncbi:MAG TPA: DNA-formamidopyrimidine glycosylase family protein [Propionibacteriaceae bacterium]|nr:DNA-formamidopyrimidine glycosylase family protein [Propionibacteriaceae bacterium]
MPELPEVEALRGFLSAKCLGRTVSRVQLASLATLKTFNPPLEALLGLEIDSVDRHGKFIDIGAQGVHLVFHLARAGWLVWKDALPDTLVRPGRGPLSLRVGLDDGSGFDLTEAGTRRKLAVYVVNDPADVGGVATLGPDPLSPAFTRDAFAAILTSAGRSQIKGILRDQRTIAGIGNAYSDEILHAAKLSPFKPASGLSEAEVDTLYSALTTELTEAIVRASGLAAKDLKDNKRGSMRVHGRTGQPCPVCGDTVAEVSFAESSLQYCPTCQTGGKPLADRRMSRLLK